MSDVPDARARRIRIAIIVAAAVLVIVGGPIAAFAYLTYIPDTSKPKIITDANKIVAIDLPAGWFEDTRKDAGEISTEGDSGDETEPYRVPDIEASKNLLDSEIDDLNSETNCLFDVTIGVPERGTSHDAQHQAQVAAALDGYDAVRHVQTTSTRVSGYPALSTTKTVRVDDMFGVVLLTTVMTEDHLITFDGYTDLPDDPRGQNLQRVMTNARID